MKAFFDTHAHLSSLRDRGIEPRPLLDNLFGEGFTGILDVGTDAGDLAPRLAEFGAYPRIWFSAGLWPSAETIADRRSCLAVLERELDAAPDGKLVAVGEAGLDRHWNREEDGADLAGERELFDHQAALARERDLALIVHSREAAAETADILKAQPGLRGVIHCYSYGPAETRRFLDLGFAISFAGNLSYKNAANLREALSLVPLDRLLLETDTPYLAPVPHRGETAHPGLIDATYALAAELRGLSIPELAAIVARNARALFGVPEMARTTQS